MENRSFRPPGAPLLTVVGPARAGVATVSAKGPYGVRVVSGGGEWEQLRPVSIALASGRISGRRKGYDTVEQTVEGFVGAAEVRVSARTSLVVVDTWRACGPEVEVAREVAVRGGEDDGFMTSLTLARHDPAGWADVVPFAPGALYGDSEPVPALAVGSPELRRRGTRHFLCREDRLAAPMVALWYPDGDWVAVLHEATGASTTVADRGKVAGGETLVDERFGFASLGGLEVEGRAQLGAFFPGSEGPVTYSTGEAPLRQHRRWRRRFHPLAEGVSHRYQLVFRWGTATAPAEFFSASWRWAWDKLGPRAAPVDIDDVLTASASVLAGQVVTNGMWAGVPLEVDAVSGRGEPGAPAIMGFVGANTDAAYVLLRVAERVGAATGASYSALAEQVLDAFARLKLSPPRGEGFDLGSGRPTTYRRIRGTPAVYTRSVADGCAGTLKAWAYESSRGREHPNWLAWACSGADWLLSAQGPDGSFPRAWAAGTGAVLEVSKTASHVPVPFLVRIAGATGKSVYLDAALRAAEFCWRAGGSRGCFAGATLDNPDVVDKESAIFALEAFLDLHAATGDAVWLERAVVAGSLAETWIYIWDVVMPADAAEEDLHWKPGVPTVGEQLIATGVSTCDGFLAMNAAAFAALYRLTGDEHFLEVARLVTHGTKAMLALPGRAFDLHGPGWQQEHWCLAIPRGRGIARHWLPWVAVANVEGILRLEDLDGTTEALVLRPAI
jgi:hypothetical protein